MAIRNDADRRAAGSEAGPLLTVENLAVDYASRHRLVRAVDAVSFSLRRGETLGLVGESGCGKSSIAMALLALHDPRNTRVTAQRIDFCGQSLIDLPESRMNRIRGNRISLIFQDAATSLNPVFTVGRQLTEILERHTALDAAEIRRTCIDLLGSVGIPAPERRLSQYPFEFSGGMRQRILIASAIATRPDIIIADEPTTALDVTVQAQVLETLRRLQNDIEAGMLLITHNLGMVAQTCQRVLVLYAGGVVEEASVDALFDNPLHPYTQGLIKATPRLGRRERLQSIRGAVPALGNIGAGCPFVSRCDVAIGRCHHEKPALTTPEAGRKVACWVRQ